VVLLVGTLLTPSFGGVPAVAALEDDVTFGMQRTTVAPGLDFEVLCHVTASYDGVAVRDGASAPAVLATRPGGCVMTLYLLGVPVPLPLPFQTPLGYLPLFLPNVRILTLGFVDVTVDLTARLRGAISGDPPALTASPAAAEWTTWGPVETTVGAHVGVRGGVLTTYESFRLTYVIDLLVSLHAFGMTLFTWYAPLVTMEGVPIVRVPVAIDLVPNAPVITEALAPSPYTIETAWTRSSDSDFARYAVAVTGGGVRRVFFVTDPTDNSLAIDVKPMTTYTVVVTLIDAGGLWASSRAASITTPRAPDPRGDGVLGSLPDPGVLR